MRALLAVAFALFSLAGASAQDYPNATLANGCVPRSASRWWWNM